MRNRRLAYGALACLSVLLLAACGSGPDGGGGPPQQRMTYLMPFAPSGSEADLYVAKERGYFTQEGIDLAIMPGKDSQTAVNQVATGGADIAVVAVKDQLINASKGQPTVAVGNRWWRGTTGVFVPDQSGINDLAGLQGRQVLHSTASIADLLRSTMEARGLDPAAVRFAAIAPSALASTFANGQGDALLTAVPAYRSVVAERRPSRILLLEDYGLTLPSYVFVVSPAFLQQHPDRVRGFLRAAYRGEVDAQQDPQAAAEAMRSENPALDLAATAQQLTDWSGFICGRAATAAKAPLSAMPAEEYRAGIDLLTRQKVLTAPVDTGAVLTNAFLDTTERTC